MAIVGNTAGLITIVMPLLVAVNGTAHGELDVMVQVIICPLVNVEDV